HCFLLIFCGAAGLPTSAPPGGQRSSEPFSSQEVDFVNGPVSLSGSLLTPKGEGPFRRSHCFTAPVRRHETVSPCSPSASRRMVARRSYSTRGGPASLPAHGRRRRSTI